MLNKAPTKYTLAELMDEVKKGTNISHDGDRWVPARPEGYFSPYRRLKYAWKVFTGKADIVIWPGGQ